jgi:hypothetical protein
MGAPRACLQQLRGLRGGQLASGWAQSKESQVILRKMQASELVVKNEVRLPLDKLLWWRRLPLSKKLNTESTQI